VALTRHRENVTLFVATETARDLGQLARQMARLDESRAASQFHAVENPEPSRSPSLAARRARSKKPRLAVAHRPVPQKVGRRTWCER
jgi:hypothetical protein